MLQSILLVVLHLQHKAEQVLILQDKQMFRLLSTAAFMFTVQQPTPQDYPLLEVQQVMP
jgi:hypothetical protein